MKKIATLSAALATLAAPLIASAAGGLNLQVIEPYKADILNLINGILLPVLIALAFIVFLFGIYKYFILGAANESEKGEGRKFAMWGVIGFVIIFSLWGIVRVGIGIFGLGGQNVPPTPTFNTGGAQNSPNSTGGNQSTFPASNTNTTGGNSASAYDSCMDQYEHPQYCSCIAADYGAEYCAAEYPDYQTN